MLGIATSRGGNTTDLGLVIRAFALIQFNTKDFIFKKLRFALLTEFASSLNDRFFYVYSSQSLTLLRCM